MVNTINECVITEEHSAYSDEWYGRWFECPSCDSANIRQGTKFCCDCGVKLTWNLTKK